MEPSYDLQFVDAMKTGNSEGDSFALSLLDGGHITSNSKTACAHGNPGDEWTLLVAAIHYERETLIRRLVELGADINEFHTTLGVSDTPAGYAIMNNKVLMLSLCFKLGADMKCVSRVGFEVSSPSFSAVELAIEMRKPDCLEYLLEAVIRTRPVELSARASTDLCLMARTGSQAMGTYRLLETRGYDFKILEGYEMDLYDEDEERAAAEKRTGVSSVVSFAEVILACAKQSGDADLVQYLVEKLSLVGDARKIDCAKEYVAQAVRSDPGRFPSLSEEETQRVDALLSKYECVSCRTVRSAVRGVQLCSSNCPAKANTTRTVGGRSEERSMQSNSASLGA